MTRSFSSSRSASVFKSRQIDNVFNALHEFSEWGYNGNPNDSFSIDSDELIRNIAQEKKEGEIIVLDIGAGDGSWARERARRIVTNPNFPVSITVHFYNLIGEKGFISDSNMKVIPQITEEIGSNCIIHNVTRCKIEELSNALSVFNLEKRVDYINSSWASRHLVDPAGTLLQAYALLSEDGILSMDGFFILYENQIHDGSVDTNIDYGRNMLSLLKYMNVQFLMEKYTRGGAVCHFIIKKRDDSRCELPLQYFDLLKNVSLSSQNSDSITVFKNGNVDNAADWTDDTIIYGSRSLLNELRFNGVFLNTGPYGRAMITVQLPDDCKKYICVVDEFYSACL